MVFAKTFFQKLIHQRRIHCYLALCVVTILSYFTYVQGYSNPNAFFWDENYHVASAQKYLNGIFFMEPHPPLGKLLIALGEKILHKNAINDQFIDTDHSGSAPEGFSFAGYRLFPTLLAWFCAPLLFLIFLEITRRISWALLLSFLYIFDNALIVHSRGAMLEGIQLFFICALTLQFLKLYRSPFLSHNKKASSISSRFIAGLLSGALFACIMATKINGLILGTLFLVLAFKHSKKTVALLQFFSAVAISFSAVFILIWEVHFNLGKKIISTLPDNGFYQASSDYKDILTEQKTGSLSSLYVMLRDSIRYIPHYQRGVPKLNLCNAGENGSPALFWPIGARAINYRWEKKDGLTRYLYLQCNPITWLLGIVGILGSLSLLISSNTRRMGRSLKQPGLLYTVLFMYLGYMGVMVSLSRVMYLYHYFIPLLFSYLLFGLFIRELEILGRVKGTIYNKTLLLSFCASISVLGYALYSPLTYATPISDEKLKQLSLLSLWDLRCANCSMVNPIANPTCDPKVKPFPNVSISGVRAEKAYQEWGDPRQNVAVEQAPIVCSKKRYSSGIGVHARSSITFPTVARFSLFQGKVAIPDYVAIRPGKPGSVVFEVLGDGISLWKSPELHAYDEPIPFSISITGIKSLELVVKDANDGIDNDHAVWLEPEFL